MYLTIILHLFFLCTILAQHLSTEDFCHEKYGKEQVIKGLEAMPVHSGDCFLDSEHNSILFHCFSKPSGLLSIRLEEEYLDLHCPPGTTADYTNAMFGKVGKCFPIEIDVEDLLMQNPLVKDIVLGWPAEEVTALRVFDIKEQVDRVLRTEPLSDPTVTTDGYCQETFKRIHLDELGQKVVQATSRYVIYGSTEETRNAMEFHCFAGLTRLSGDVQALHCPKGSNRYIVEDIDKGFCIPTSIYDGTEVEDPKVIEWYRRVGRKASGESSQRSKPRSLANKAMANAAKRQRPNKAAMGVAEVRSVEEEDRMLQLRMATIFKSREPGGSN